MGSRGDSGTGAVEPTEGVDGSGVEIWMGLGEEVGVTGSSGSLLDSDDGTGSADALEDGVGRIGFDGTPFVEPISVFDEG